jgi:hypothetical protein
MAGCRVGPRVYLPAAQRVMPGVNLPVFCPVIPPAFPRGIPRAIPRTVWGIMRGQPRAGPQLGLPKIRCHSRDSGGVYCYEARDGLFTPVCAPAASAAGVSFVAVRRIPGSGDEEVVPVKPH